MSSGPVYYRLEPCFICTSPALNHREDVAHHSPLFLLLRRTQETSFRGRRAHWVSQSFLHVTLDHLIPLNFLINKGQPRCPSSKWHALIHRIKAPRTARGQDKRHGTKSTLTYMSLGLSWRWWCAVFTSSRDPATIKVLLKLVRKLGSQTFAMQAWELSLMAWASFKKSGMMAHTCNPRTGWLGHRRILVILA